MEIVPTPNFEREFKQLRKKYPSLSADLLQLTESLQENPELGVSLGQGCFKIRLAIRSKGRGKSGGARVITYVQIVADTIFLLSIYNKSDKADLQANELDDLLGQVPEE
ncbi:MAG: type II toxin-antitoxin system RelE/ParE family toxin [Saprospiraceae bacterium]